MIASQVTDLLLVVYVIVLDFIHIPQKCQNIHYQEANRDQYIVQIRIPQMQERTIQVTPTKVKMENQKDVLIVKGEDVPQDVFNIVAKNVATMSI